MPMWQTDVMASIIRLPVYIRAARGAAAPIYLNPDVSLAAEATAVLTGKPFTQQVINRPSARARYCRGAAVGTQGQR